MHYGGQTDQAGTTATASDSAYLQKGKAGWGARFLPIHRCVPACHVPRFAATTLTCVGMRRLKLCCSEWPP